MASSTITKMSAPRTRGWRASDTDGRAEGEVSPVHAGVQTRTCGLRCLGSVRWPWAPTARGWGCTGQGLSVLHEIRTFVEYTRMSASSPRPSCSTCGRHEREIDLTEAIEGTASAYPL